MALQTMYPPQKDSPLTFLSGDILSSDTLITVANASALPQSIPYPLTIGVDKAVTETVMVTEINLETNQLTVVRSVTPITWVAGTKCARVFTAEDLMAVQHNIQEISETVGDFQESIEQNTGAVEDLVLAVGDSNSGLIKGLADEITRATNAETAETTRATTAEGNLMTGKVNRSELAQVITDWVYSADGTNITVTISRYNASTQQTTQYTRTLPIVSNDAVGIMTPEAYTEISTLRNDVNALQQQGGRFIGTSFATKAALNNYTIPPTVRLGDFTYVLDDETKDNSTTRYVFNGTQFVFTFVIDYDPVGLADSSTPGLVKSDSGSTAGKVFVETDGTMSVIGWDALNTSVSDKVPTARTVNGKALSSNITLSASDVSAVPTTRTVNSKALSTNITLTASDVSAVPTTRTVNSKALSENITLSASDVGARSSSWTPTAADVGAVPTTRTVNSKALSSNITLSASDVSAVPTSDRGVANGVATLDASGKVTPAQVAGKLDKSGGTMDGTLVAGGAQALAVAQVRNATISDADPSGGANGDLWFKYEV